MDEKKEIQTIHNNPYVIQIRERFFLLGRDFLGINRKIVDQCELRNSQRKNVVWVDGKGLTIQASAETVSGPLTTNFEVKAYYKGDLLWESTASHVHPWVGTIVEQKDWPFMIFGKDKIIVCHMRPGSMELAQFDRVSIKMINRSIAKNGFEPGLPHVVWTYIYKEGSDSMKLVYLEYKHCRWWPVMTVDGREVFSAHKGDFKFITILDSYPEDLAAELWIYRNRERIGTLTLHNYVRGRDKNYKMGTTDRYDTERVKDYRMEAIKQWEKRMLRSAGY